MECAQEGANRAEHRGSGDLKMYEGPGAFMVCSSACDVTRNANGATGEKDPKQCFPDLFPQIQVCALAKKLL